MTEELVMLVSAARIMTFNPTTSALPFLAEVNPLLQGMYRTWLPFVFDDRLAAETDGLHLLIEGILDLIEASA